MRAARVLRATALRGGPASAAHLPAAPAHLLRCRAGVASPLWGASARSPTSTPLLRVQQQHTFWSRWMSGGGKSAEEGKAEEAAAGAGEGDAAEGAAGVEDATAEGAASSAEQQQIETLTAEVAEWKDKYMRQIAEMENLRRRMTSEVESSKKFGIQKFAKDLLEVVDTLGLAMDAVPEEERGNKENPHLVSLYQGLKGINYVTLQVLSRHGMEKVDPLGEPFDPNLHEALFQVPDPEKTPGTVMAVTKTGFTLHGRTVRPAGVGVVQKP